MNRPTFLAAILACLVVNNVQSGEHYRLHEGLTTYIHNPDGKDFTINLDVRDLNLFANGPREVLFKVYDPDGKPVVREVIADDGVTSPNFPDRIGGWDHELQYYMNLNAKGTVPAFRFSAWSDPKRLETIVKRTFTRPIKGGKPGVYRIVLAGTPDHYVTLDLQPALKYAVSGHPTFMYGYGDLLKKRFIYVPKGTTGIFFAATEPDLPRSRKFKVTAPDGKVLFEGMATGGYTASITASWQEAAIDFPKGGDYEGKLLTLEVSDGPGDYLVKVTLQQPKTAPFNEYIGMGSLAVYAPDEATAHAIQGGTMVVDDLVFWHPFQVRFHKWLKEHPLAANASEAEKTLRTELETLHNSFRLLETSDGRGSRSWINWGYSFGYYGCRVWRPSWLLMPRSDVPQEVKDIIKEGLLVGGDRLSFAVAMEKVNGNAFSQIPVALWYCHRASGDPLQKQLFETFFDRWKSEGWGVGCGLSKSGDSQEHFAHDCHYGSYLMDNWRGGTWVKDGILDDAKDDPRFQQVIERYRDLYSYLFCRDASGGPVPANPWSSRTAAAPHLFAKNWELDGRKWKGEPGEDFTVSVNGGDEWFAARRKNYYVLTFHGRLAPEWMSQCFPGQLGFGGGTLCQLTVPGKGPVLISTLAKEYGEGMHPSLWRKFHLHALVGEMWDGRPLISGISEHDNARLSGNTVSSSGEVRDTHVRVSRSYTYEPGAIACNVSLAESDYGRVLSIWSHGRLWSEVKEAYEMIPVMAGAGKNRTVITLRDAGGKDLGEATVDAIEAQTVHIDRGGYGVDVVLDKPMKVKLGETSTVLVQLATPGIKATPAAEVKLSYRLVPFGN